MQISKRLLRFVALASFVLVAASLALCVKIYVGGSFLKAGATINPNPKVIGGMIDMIRIAYFSLIPAISIMLFISSFFLWVASKNFGSDKETKT